MKTAFVIFSAHFSAIVDLRLGEENMKLKNDADEYKVMAEHLKGEMANMGNSTDIEQLKAEYEKKL